jgi:hypothetical protein
MISFGNYVRKLLLFVLLTFWSLAQKAHFPELLFLAALLLADYPGITGAAVYSRTGKINITIATSYSHGTHLINPAFWPYVAKSAPHNACVWYAKCRNQRTNEQYQEQGHET